jgi:hypothetical protein
MNRSGKVLQKAMPAKLKLHTRIIDQPSFPCMENASGTAIVLRRIFRNLWPQNYLARDYKDMMQILWNTRFQIGSETYAIIFPTRPVHTMPRLIDVAFARIKSTN